MATRLESRTAAIDGASRQGRAYLRAATAAVALGSILIGFPMVLGTVVGWPLPQHFPTSHQLGRALLAPIPDSAWPKGFAIAGWAAWGWFALAFIIEVVSSWRHRGAVRNPRWWLAGGVATVLVACIVGTLVAHGRSPSALHPTGAPDRMPAAAATAPSTLKSAMSRLTMHEDRPPVASSTTVVVPAPHVAGSSPYEPPPPSGRAVANSPSLSTGNPVPVESPPTTSPAASQGSSPETSVSQSTVPTTTPATRTAGGAAHGTAHVSRPKVRADSGIRIGPESFIAVSLATAVVALLGLMRLRKRHKYVPGPVEAGCDLRPVPLVDALRRVCVADRTSREDSQKLDSSLEDPRPDDPVSALPILANRPSTDSLTIGVKDGKSVGLDLTGLGAIEIVGGLADSVARAWLTSLLLEEVQGSIEVIASGATLGRLLPGTKGHNGIRAFDSPETVATAVEVEVFSRTRRLTEAELPDAATYRRTHPEDPFPTLLVVVDEIPEDTIERWRSISTDGPRLAILVIALGEVGFESHIEVGQGGRVLSVHPESLVSTVQGCEAYRLSAPDAVALLGVGISVDHDVRGINEPTTPPASLHIDDLASTLTFESASEPENGQLEAGEASTPCHEITQGLHEPQKPVQIQLLGNLRIIVQGEEIRTGLRTASIELLAWFALRPDGGRAEAAIDDIWGDLPIARGPQRFWTALGNLRSRLRIPDALPSDVLAKSGEHYLLDADLLDIDLWRFQAALKAASLATKDDTAQSALEEAVSVYGGSFANGKDYLWCEIARADLHRRAVDAHLSLAEILERNGEQTNAVEILEKVIELDRYAEEPYRRLMGVLATLGRRSQVDYTWRTLQDRMSELDLDVDTETARLYAVLTRESDSVRLTAGPTVPAGVRGM